MHVQNIKIKNFKGILNAETQLNGNSVWLIGPNEAGKTSFIDAIFKILQGRNLPPKALTQGKSDGEVSIDLGEYIAKLIMRDDRKPVFQLFSKDGKPVPRPRDVMNDLLGIVDFNPMDFFAMSDTKQVEYFCTVLDVDFTEQNDEYDELYESRSGDNKLLQTHNNNLEPYKTELLTADMVDEVELTNKINLFTTRDADRTRIIDGVNEKEKERGEVLTELDRVKQKLEKLNDDIFNGDKWLKENPIIVLTDEKERLENAQAINAPIIHAKEQAANEDVIEGVKKAIQETEEAMQKINTKKKDILEEKITIPGLTFNGSRFLLNGLPFADTQVNTAAQIITGLKIAKELLNKVKILRLDASLIDNQHMKEVTAWGDKNDVQLFMELLERDGDGLIIQVEEEV